MWRTWVIGFDGKVQEDMEIEEVDARAQEWGWVRLIETDNLIIDRWGLDATPPPEYTEFWIARKKES